MGGNAIVVAVVGLTVATPRQARQLRGLVALAIAVCLLAGCGSDGKAAAPCSPTPALRPSSIVGPDRYAQVVGPKVARFWLTGTSQQRPTVIALTGGGDVVVDPRTKLLGRCVHPCWTYVSLRPRTQVADALYPTVIREGIGAQLPDSVWHVGDGLAEMSSGLRLKLASGTKVSLSDRELRRLGDWVTVTVDDPGAVTKIEQTVFGCA